jgi:type I restriction-modification system DNA methylase subunit
MLFYKSVAGVFKFTRRRQHAEMRVVFEELIRKFAEISNETAGEHFTPREVIRLMVNLILIGVLVTHVVSGFSIFEAVNGVLTEYGISRYLSC